MALRNFKAGCFVTDTPSDIKTFNCSPSTGNYDTMQQGATNYQVPVGKTLYITGINVDVSVAGSGYQIGYADTAIDDAVGPPTTPVIMLPQKNPATATLPEIWDCFVAIPAQKYPFLRAIGGNVSATLYGYEE